VRLPPHVLVHIYDHLQGAREQYFVQLLNWIPLMYVRYVFVQYAAVCHCRRFVCVSGGAVRVRSGHWCDNRNCCINYQSTCSRRLVYPLTARCHDVHRDIFNVAISGPSGWRRGLCKNLMSDGFLTFWHRSFTFQC
jgi:hypothetical protein